MFIIHGKDSEYLNREFDSCSNDLDKFNSFVESFLNYAKCGKVCSNRVLISCEEVFLNICSYAYAGKVGKIFVDASLEGENLKIVIKDHGVPFDPSSYVSKNVCSKEHVGGLGIFLVKKLIDKVEYFRSNGENVLTLYKKIGE